MLARFFSFLVLSFMYSMIVGAFIGGVVLWRLEADLPNSDYLANYQPKVLSRFYMANGEPLAEHALEKRIFVPYEEVPTKLIEAFISAEDRKFFEHRGFDITGIMRSLFVNIERYFTNRRPVGGSTITQQVARIFLLSQDLRLERKIKEAMIAIRIEELLSKERIMELYLNEIYMGIGIYGVAAASLHYFGKPLEDLNIAEMAYLAALPKGPNNYHPIRHHARAITRRNWVLARMEENEFISGESLQRERQRPLLYTPYKPSLGEAGEGQYFSEEVRRRVGTMYGLKTVYSEGLSVHTTLDPTLQLLADTALRQGLITYDRRHGWRGVVDNINVDSSWAKRLQEIEPAQWAKPWRLAVVLEVTPTSARVGLRPPSPDDNQRKQEASPLPQEKGFLPLIEVQWARAPLYEGRVGKKITSVEEVLNVGDVIYVERMNRAALSKKEKQRIRNQLPPEARRSQKIYGLRQIPLVNGAVVAIDPHTGRVLAMSGGFHFAMSQFNRATQAKRQPGSAFKPFIYSAALDNGFTPSSQILDLPFVIERDETKLLWKPSNYDESFLGISTLRKGLEQSRNLATLHLASALNIDVIYDYLKPFNLLDDLAPEIGIVLGIKEISLLNLAAGYCVFVNGGRRIEPFLVEYIQDRSGSTIYKHDKRTCWKCNAERWAGQEEPEFQETRPQIISAQAAYQVVSIMQGVVERGTGTNASLAKHPIAGKTGTTNEEKDAWFIGFSPNLLVGVFVGFDVPQPLGYAETGSNVAAPIFANIMEKALEKTPPVPFKVPPGISLVRVDVETGLPVSPQESGKGIIWESFKVGTEPKIKNELLQTALSGADADLENIPKEAPPSPQSLFEAGQQESISGTGGLY